MTDEIVLSEEKFITKVGTVVEYNNGASYEGWEANGEPLEYGANYFSPEELKEIARTFGKLTTVDADWTDDA